MVILKVSDLSTIALLSFAASVDAFWRMPLSSRTGLARIDPIFYPGEIADHANTIYGGGDFSEDVEAIELKNSSCTSAQVTQDKSAYLTPSLHFEYPDGTTVIVPQIGGMLAYYLLFSDDEDTDEGNIKAFPEGFVMAAGDKNLRNFTGPVPDPPVSLWTANDTTQFALSQKALGFNCLNDNEQTEPTLYRHFMPNKTYLDANCVDGLRLELMFPSCWNGADLDSPDHRSHMAYPDYVMTGSCPEGYDVKVPSLLYETVWDTNSFSGVEGQFVLSTGDPTGYSYNGDFMMGWESSGFLQDAINTCTNSSGNIQDCPLFDIQSEDDAAQCTFDVPEDVEYDNIAGPRQGLAVSVPIQSGPAPATEYPIITLTSEEAVASTAVSTRISIISDRIARVSPVVNLVTGVSSTSAALTTGVYSTGMFPTAGGTGNQQSTGPSTIRPIWTNTTFTPSSTMSTSFSTITSNVNSTTSETVTGSGTASAGMTGSTSSSETGTGTVTVNETGTLTVIVNESGTETVIVNETGTLTVTASETITETATQTVTSYRGHHHDVSTSGGTVLSTQTVTSSSETIEIIVISTATTVTVTASESTVTASECAATYTDDGATTLSTLTIEQTRTVVPVPLSTLPSAPFGNGTAPTATAHDGAETTGGGRRPWVAVVKDPSGYGLVSLERAPRKKRGIAFRG